MDKKMLHMAAFTLVMVGALNWGLIGLLNVDVVRSIFGGWPILVSIVYILVGISGAYLIATHKGDCKLCAGK